MAAPADENAPEESRVDAPPEPAVTLETARLALRQLGPADAERLQAVFCAAEDHFLALTGAGPGADAAEREIAGCMATPGRTVALATLLDTGEDVGAVAWWEGNPEAEVALLGTLIVAPAHRGSGLAREALEGLEMWLRGRGIVRMRAGVLRRYRPANLFLQALGFTELSIREHTKLGIAGAGTALYEKPLGGG